MEAVTIKAPIGKVISSTDRKYGGEGNIETLAQSMKTHGLIHPPAVKEIPEKEGHYRVIAGRRRHAAAKLLGWKHIEVTVYPKGADEEAIALAENVNREDMHPLDEAETFSRQLEAGKPVEEVAKYYSRSVSGIHQRVRLTNLIGDLKMMFRDGKINLSTAALIAGLPEEDQEKFFKKFGDKNEVNKWEASSFVHSVQKFKIKDICDEQCAACKKRTHNSTPGLFDDDFAGIEDVCFDNECYAEKWENTIAGLIAKEGNANTENKIIFDQNIPKFLPKKTESITLAGVEYSILPSGKFTCNKTAKKAKSKTAWMVGRLWDSSSKSHKLGVLRVEYKENERPSYSSGSTPSDPVKVFMVDQIPGIKPEDRKYAAAVLEKKFQSHWRLKNKIKETMFDAIIEKRLQEKSGENLAALYIAEKCSGEDEKGVWHDIDPDYQNIFNRLFHPHGITELSDISGGPILEKVFLFLIATGLRANDMPDPDDSDMEWDSTEDTLFWKFAQMDKESYLQMYRETLEKEIKDVAGEQNQPQEEAVETVDDFDGDDD